MRYGKGGAPAWLTALQLAEAWGVPPWEIMEHKGGIMWAARWVAYREQMARVKRMTEKKK